MKTKIKSLANCTEKELFRFRSGGTELGNFWLSCDTFHVSLNEQKIGEKPTQGITMKRSDFNRIIAAYLKPRKFVRK